MANEIQVISEAASLPPSIATSLRERVSKSFEVAGYTIQGNVPEADLREAIRALNEQCEPAAKIDIARWLAELYALTKQRAEEQVTLDLAVQAFASRLEKYPAYAVEAALREWPDKSKWWPSWQELKAEIEAADKLTMVRQAVYQALDGRHSKPKASAPRHTSELNMMDRSDFLEKVRAEYPLAFGMKQAGEMVE